MDINLELRRFASGFAYSVIKNIEKDGLEDIGSMILFGSVAQGRADKASDVDIFIDTSAVPSRVGKLRARISALKDEFLLSNEGLSYKERGIYNEIRVILGSLPDWPEMKKSVSSGGVVLYGPYKDWFGKKGLSHSVIFFWETGGRNRGAFLNKLYGYRANGKTYSGLIQKLGGTKIGKSAAIIPSGNGRQLMETMGHYGVGYKALEVFV